MGLLSISNHTPYITRVGTNRFGQVNGHSRGTGTGSFIRWGGIRRDAARPGRCTIKRSKWSKTETLSSIHNRDLFVFFQDGFSLLDDILLRF